MADVFISYSRRDSEFVQRLNTAFVGANRVVWVDWQSIPRGEDWWREIELGIENADFFISVISEHWLTSEICHKELLHARQNNKRVLPVIRQQIRDDIEKQVKGTWMDLDWEQLARDNWDYVRHLNWIFFDDDTKFDTEFSALLTALEEDQPYIKAHTRYQNNALEWERSNRNPGFLLVGDNLAFAETWFTQSIGKEPQPTNIQEAYITESRRSENENKQRAAERERRIRQFRLASLFLTLIGGIAIAVTLVAFSQANDARNQAVTATVAQGIAIAAQETSIKEANDAGTREALATAAQGEAILEQETAVSGANDAGTQAALAVETLTPIPVTLTHVANTILVGENRLESLRLALLANQYLAGTDLQSGALFTTTANETAALLSIRALNTAYTRQADAALVEATNRLSSSRMFQGHTDFVSSVAFSPDGQYIISGSGDNTAQLWETETGKQIRQFIGHTESVNSVAFSPDGRYILTGSSDNTARLWALDIEPELHQFIGHTESINSVAFSPDGRYILTSGYDNIVRLWDANTWEEVRVFHGSSDTINEAIFSPDGRYILTHILNCCVQLWDTESGAMVNRFEGLSGSLSSIAFSPDGSAILTASNSNYAASLTDIETGDRLQEFDEHTEWVGSAAFSPMDNIVFTGEHNVARLWNTKTGEIIRYLEGYDGYLISVAFSPDGHFVATGGEDNMLRLWEVDYRDFTAYACTFLTHDFNLESSLVFGLPPYDKPTCPHLAFDPTPPPPTAYATWTSIPTRTLPTWTSIPQYSTVAAQVISLDTNISSLDSSALRIFGPTNGVIEHNADDEEVAWKLTDVLLENFIAETEFYNPFDTEMGSWDYGFIFRRNEEGHYRLSIESDTSWQLRLRVGGESHVISRGKVNNLNVSEGGHNHLRLTVRGDTAEFFVNNEFVTRLNVSGRQLSGDFAIATGIYTGNEITGEVTQYEGFTIWEIDSPPTATSAPLTTVDAVVLTLAPSPFKLFGPAYGDLEHDSEDGDVKRDLATVTLSDFIMEVRFTNPYNLAKGEWDYGINFRRNDSQRYWLIVASNKTWALELWDGNEYNRISEGEIERLDVGENGSNRLSLIVKGDSGQFFINGEFIASLDVSANRIAGDIGVVTGFYHDDKVTGEVTSYSDFTIWEIPQSAQALNLTATNIVLSASPTLTLLAHTPTSLSPIVSTTDLALTTTIVYGQMTQTQAASILTATVVTWTPTPTAISIQVVSVGETRGEIPIGGGQLWTYQGEAGEIITVRVNADQPANNADDRTGLLDTFIIIRTKDGKILAEADDIQARVITDSLVSDLRLPLAGVYEIEVRSFDNQTGGNYTLTIESDKS